MNALRWHADQHSLMRFWLTCQERVATELSYKKLGLHANKGGQPSLL